MKTMISSVLAAALLTSAAPALAQDMANTEKLSLQPKRVKGLLLGYGYELGEYSG